ncbi:hypothetical protein M5524_04625 [Duganella sp. BuS-21]
MARRHGAQVALVLAAQCAQAGAPGRTAYSATKFAMGGFNAAGGALGSSSLKEDKAMPVEECASLIIDGMERRKREVVMSAKGRLGRWMKLIAPGLVEKMALVALKDDVKP